MHDHTRRQVRWSDVARAVAGRGGPCVNQRQSLTCVGETAAPPYGNGCAPWIENQLYRMVFHLVGSCQRMLQRDGSEHPRSGRHSSPARLSAGPSPAIRLLLADPVRGQGGAPQIPARRRRHAHSPPGVPPDAWLAWFATPLARRQRHSCLRICCCPVSDKTNRTNRHPPAATSARQKNATLVPQCSVTNPAMVVLNVAPAVIAKPTSPIARLNRPPRCVISATTNGTITPTVDALIPSSTWQVTIEAALPLIANTRQRTASATKPASRTSLRPRA